jgi:hypothetical protein
MLGENILLGIDGKDGMSSEKEEISSKTDDMSTERRLSMMNEEYYVKWM